MKSFPFLAALALLLQVAVIPESAAKPFEIPAIEVLPISDTAADRKYELYVKLPEDYDPQGDKKHPVIYIVDARWNMEVISGSVEYFVKDAILVGISWEIGMKPQHSRMRDYTPIKYTGKNYTRPTGQAQQHLEFIKKDIFPFVESRYRTDPGNRTYYGFSVGGSFGSYILLTQPDTFRNYILGSPATLFDDHFIHKHKSVVYQAPKKPGINVFVSVGDNEHPVEIEHAISLKHFLTSQESAPYNVRLSVIESADHGQAFPTSAIKSLVWLNELAL